MDIGDILSSLSAEDMKNLQNIAASLTGSAQGGERDPQPNQKQGQSPGPSRNPNSDQNFGTNQRPESQPLGLDPKAFGDIAGLMSKLGSSGDDPRCRLISSLKPMLSPEKQKRADEAIRIMKLIDLLPVLKDSGLLKGVLGQ